MVIDVSNSPSFEDEAVMEFFTTSTTNLLAAEAEAGVRHHVALSVVGADRLPDSGYLRAKVAQEELIDGSTIPYTIVRATQFFEFVKRIADEATDGDVVRLPHVLIQPIAADDVAAAVCEVSQRPPADGIVEIGGPEQFRFDEFIARGSGGEGRSADRRRRPGGPLLRSGAARALAGPGQRRSPRRDPIPRLAGSARQDVAQRPSGAAELSAWRTGTPEALVERLLERHHHRRDRTRNRSS